MKRTAAGFALLAALSSAQPVSAFDWLFQRPDRAPEVGEVAPDFTLRLLEQETALSLSDFRGERPVVLIFGSFT